MADDDRLDDTRDPAAPGREQHRDEGPTYRESRLLRPPRIGRPHVPRSGAVRHGHERPLLRGRRPAAEYGGYGRRIRAGSRRIREGGAARAGAFAGRATTATAATIRRSATTPPTRTPTIAKAAMRCERTAGPTPTMAAPTAATARWRLNPASERRRRP